MADDGLPQQLLSRQRLLSARLHQVKLDNVVLLHQ